MAIYLDVFEYILKHCPELCEEIKGRRLGVEPVQLYKEALLHEMSKKVALGTGHNLDKVLDVINENMLVVAMGDEWYV